jgi:hypothetical protein
LLVVAAQQIGDGPQKGGGLGEIHSSWAWLQISRACRNKAVVMEGVLTSALYTRRGAEIQPGS